MAKVGVESTLTDVEQALLAHGHEVIQLENEEDASGCDCCVVSGQQENVMGIEDTTTNAAVVSAQGLTAEEVCQRVDQSVGAQ
ncbi:YkuS family protein [Salipaludibacillus daqingensis]|uniref:YkuS family protein n=1 Tax=Salipaludibacillus daqingensis TaxID=3041001 RepID=UPI0024763FCD|nr:YkuS family protein [Salipaludibacillus daqingensis]